MPIWADVLLAVVLALFFAAYFAIVIERAKHRAIAAVIEPKLEEVERITAAIRTTFAPAIHYTTKLVDVDGTTIGAIPGMSLGYTAGETITYAGRTYGIVEVRPETDGASDGALVVRLTE